MILKKLIQKDISIQTVNLDKRIAIIFTNFIVLEFTEIDELSKIKRGDGGFGSTGKN